jgi:hypothetical protein
MRVAMMQPTFLPWLGYFELIYRSQRFVIADDYQFSSGSYHQRNRLFRNAAEVTWVTVPVRKKHALGLPLSRTEIAEDPPWRGRLWRQIKQNYGAAPFFAEIAPPVEAWLLQPAESLAQQNIGFIRVACDLLGLQREFRFTSARPSELPRSARVVELLRWCEADQYYCAHGSFDYMRSDGAFPVDGVEVLFQDFQVKPYRQVGARGTFVPYLSVLDALFNVGPTATLELIVRGTSKWLSWPEMCAAAPASTFNEEASCPTE